MDSHYSKAVRLSPGPGPAGTGGPALTLPPPQRRWAPAASGPGPSAPDELLVAAGRAVVDRLTAGSSPPAPAIAAVLALGSAGGPRPTSEAHLAVFLHPGPPVPPPWHHQAGNIAVYLHPRPVQDLTGACTLPETGWELATAVPLYDPSGAAATAQALARQAVLTPASHAERVRGHQRRLSLYCSRLIRLAGLTKPQVRAKHAVRFARLMYSLPQGGEGLGLGAKILQALSLAAGRPPPARPWLWWDAPMDAQALGLSPDPVSLLLMAQGLGVCPGHRIPPGLPGPPAPPPVLMTRALELLSLELPARGLDSDPAARSIIARCRHLAEVGHAAPALAVLRGAAAGWFGDDPVYLKLCGAWPAGAGPVRPQAAWPALLGSASSMLAAAQVVLAAEPRPGPAGGSNPAFG